MSSNPAGFDYKAAFDRNLGWINQEEQTKLKNACVAIAGVGGAGGYQAQALARLGVEHFKIADADTYSLSNLNRQIGATMATMGVSKVQVMKDMICQINPQAKVDTFAEYINNSNIDNFLEGVNVVMDGIDFFELEAKRLLFRKSREKHLPIVTSCPLGFGATLLVFNPQGMSFDEYFDLNDQMGEHEKPLSLLMGLIPVPFIAQYMDKKKVLESKDRRGASVCPGLMLVGALSVTEAVKIITAKREVLYVPHVYQIDLFTQQVSKKFYPLGMRSPWQRFKKQMVLKQLGLK